MRPGGDRRTAAAADRHAAVAAAGRRSDGAAARPTTTPAAAGSPPPAAPDRPNPRRPPSRCRQESEATVPKMKSHKAAQKRIGVTGCGKVVRVNAWRGHHLEIKSSRRTRRYAGKSVIGPSTPSRSAACCRTSRSTRHPWHESSAASPPTSATSASSTRPRAARARTRG